MIDSEKKLIIFGASGGAVKVIKTLKGIGVPISSLTDNDSKKWGSIVEGIAVINPNELKKIECNILIASDYQEEIEVQLLSMGILDRLVLREEYIMQYIELCLEEFREILCRKKIQREISGGKEVLIDLLECAEYGGIEIWSYMVASGLKKNGHTVTIFGKKEEIYPTPDLSKNLVELKVSYENYTKSIIAIAQEIVKKLPCSIIINRQGLSFIAAIIVKKLYPNQLKILSIIHTERIVLCRRQAFLQDQTDYIMGVSRQINQRLSEQFKISKSKIRFKESPVEYDEKIQKKYQLEKHEPIRIGYAARITKTQKRVDLLLPLIRLLETKKINYIMTIAGSGSYLPKLKSEIEKIKTHKVTIIGQISREEMKSFWKEQDIFINLSEFEGTSLSMLEAMSYGVVPIVTDVSGVNDIIDNGINGFVCAQHNIERMAEYIAYFDEHRKSMKTFGEKARQTIRKKCNVNDYITYLENVLEI